MAEASDMPGPNPPTGGAPKPLPGSRRGDSRKRVEEVPWRDARMALRCTLLSQYLKMAMPTARFGAQVHF